MGFNQCAYRLVKAQGFIDYYTNANIVEALLAEGHQVRTLSRGAYPELEALGVEHVRADLAGPVSAIERAFRGRDVVAVHWPTGYRDWGLVVQIDADGNVHSGERGDTHLVVYYDKAVVTIPVISLEALCGEPAPTNLVYSRLLIMNSVRPGSSVPFYAIVTAGLPRPLPFDNSLISGAEPCGHEALQCRLAIDGEIAVIPNLEYLQTQLEQQLDEAA